MFEVHPIPAFNDNYIWLLCEPNGTRAIVVDPGDADVVNQQLEARGLTLTAILITHHHWDHTDGVAQLVTQHDITVYGPKDSKFSGIDKPLADGDEISLLGQQLIVKTVPGHTLDHICYRTTSSSMPAQLFCGDMLFLAGCGRVFEGTMKQMLTAMHFFKTLADDTQVFCTHEYSLSNLKFAQAVEPQSGAIAQTIERCQKLREQQLPTLPTTIGSERQHNPFLRTDQASVISALQTRSNALLNSEVNVFEALRAWKDKF